jgi:hypothetical protein
MARHSCRSPVLLLLVVLAGCSASPAPERTSPPRQSNSPTEVPHVGRPVTTRTSPGPDGVYPSVGDSPAAGVCGSERGTIVSVDINVDTPSPRCAVIRADQMLRLRNRTADTEYVAIGPYSAKLLPRSDKTFSRPFGEYLARGVHVVEGSPYAGPSLWLKE